MTCSRKIRPEIGVSSIWVRENSAYRIDRSWRWPAARSAAVNGCGESGQPLARQRIDIRWPQPVADRLHRRGDGIVGFSPRPNGNGIRIWWRKKNQNRSDGRKRPSGHLKPVCRPSAATIPTSGSTPSRRSPKPPESPPCFARSTGFRSVGRPRTDRTPLTPHPRGWGRSAVCGPLRAGFGVTPSAMWPGIADVIWHGAGARDVGGGTHGPIITVCRVGIAKRSACRSVARGAMMRASSARGRGRW